ncbi:MAG: tRNA (guanosine(37)-N1)-methyltransferase TrmD [Desulfohalobiaceae bacterium]|nr:tRNA (guanosine(37)-N1)-methyltransferase TrmD [Desulfohalobiaceae bacterium]
MNYHLISIFPEFFQGPLSCGLMGRAVDRGLISYSLINPRDFARDKHRSVDDRPYGGGPGMVMSLDPLIQAVESIPDPGRVLVLSPGGRLFDQTMARELAAEEDLTLVCGRYEGIDARFQQFVPSETVSIGDFVLNGGESGALCLMEAISRLQPSFMGSADSPLEESFSSGLFDHPHYTRPADYKGTMVPEVLLSGDHRKISRWRREQALLATAAFRPDLLAETLLGPEDYSFLQRTSRTKAGRNLYLGLVHYPVLDKRNKTTAVSLTNMDIHDIARVSCSYGLGGFYVITPLQDQQELARTLVKHWREGAGKKANPDRVRAMESVEIAADLRESLTRIEDRCGRPPKLVATSARGQGSMTWKDLRTVLYKEPVFLLLGTGYGLAPEVIQGVNEVLPPLRAGSPYNHLSVRTAAAVTVDRILGEGG